MLAKQPKNAGTATANKKKQMTTFLEKMSGSPPPLQL